MPPGPSKGDTGGLVRAENETPSERAMYERLVGLEGDVRVECVVEPGKPSRPELKLDPSGEAAAAPST